MSRHSRQGCCMQSKSSRQKLSKGMRLTILCICRSFWECGTATMVVAALIMATGALAVALIDGRVPVFEIVVRCW